MNKPSLDRDEALSAMLDDALSRHEVDQLLEQLRHDPRESERMDRYSLIGMAMRGELGEVPSRDMTASIMASIRAQQVAPVPRATVLDTLRDWLGTWRLPAFGMALAATVAGIAVLVIHPAQQNPDDSFVVLTSPQVSGVQVAAKDTQKVQEMDALPDPYLVQHLTHAEGGPMTSMASNVRLVAYERP
ncbi:MAG: sigma-E factor negative regulatory protein [Gammaproteobacteria bacterium]|nr:sigma-E factor negative regulatory protein [Gammaproteobacteria bacterium]